VVPGHPIRLAAAEALGAVGPGAARAGAALLARGLDEDEDPMVRQAAYAAVRRIFGE
jgi:HEAT repeat protein